MKVDSLIKRNISRQQAKAKMDPKTTEHKDAKITPSETELTPQEEPPVEMTPKEVKNSDSFHSALSASSTVKGNTEQVEADDKPELDKKNALEEPPVTIETDTKSEEEPKPKTLSPNLMSPRGEATSEITTISPTTIPNAEILEEKNKRIKELEDQLRKHKNAEPNFSKRTSTSHEERGRNENRRYDSSRIRAYNSRNYHSQSKRTSYYDTQRKPYNSKSRERDETNRTRGASRSKINVFKLNKYIAGIIKNKQEEIDGQKRKEITPKTKDNKVLAGIRDTSKSKKSYNNRKTGNAKNENKSQGKQDINYNKKPLLESPPNYPTREIAANKDQGHESKYTNITPNQMHREENHAYYGGSVGVRPQPQYSYDTGKFQPNTSTEFNYVPSQTFEDTKESVCTLDIDSDSNLRNVERLKKRVKDAIKDFKKNKFDSEGTLIKALYNGILPDISKMNKTLAEQSGGNILNFSRYCIEEIRELNIKFHNFGLELRFKGFGVKPAQFGRIVLGKSEEEYQEYIHEFLQMKPKADKHRPFGKHKKRFRDLSEDSMSTSDSENYEIRNSAKRRKKRY